MLGCREQRTERWKTRPEARKRCKRQPKKEKHVSSQWRCWSLPSPPLMKSFLIMFQTHAVFHNHVNVANPQYTSKEPHFELVGCSHLGLQETTANIHKGLTPYPRWEQMRHTSGYNTNRSLVSGKHQRGFARTQCFFRRIGDILVIYQAPPDPPDHNRTPQRGPAISLFLTILLFSFLLLQPSLPWWIIDFLSIKRLFK